MSRPRTPPSHIAPSSLGPSIGTSGRGRRLALHLLILTGLLAAAIALTMLSGRISPPDLQFTALITAGSIILLTIAWWPAALLLAVLAALMPRPGWRIVLWPLGVIGMTILHAILGPRLGFMPLAALGAMGVLRLYAIPTALPILLGSALREFLTPANKPKEPAMTSIASPSRRNILIGAAVAVPALALPGRLRAQPPLDQLALYGPPAGPSVTLAHAVATDRFADIAGSATMTAWRTPDELRAGLTSGSILLSVVPVQAAANLYNRGFPIRLANVMTNGLLYIATGKAGISAIPDLRGRKVAVPFRGDTPEILFSQLLVHHGLNAATDLEITYAGTPIEAMQLLLAGRVEAALTAEPSTTAAVIQGQQVGKDIRRAIDLQAEWGVMTNAAPVLPQAGLAITGSFLDTHAEAVPPILAALKGANAEVLADPVAAAAHAAGALGMPAPLLAASVPHSNLVARPATEARADVERMLSAMTGTDMAAINGSLPDDGFYL